MMPVMCQAVALLLWMQVDVEDAMRLAARGDFVGARGVLLDFVRSHPNDADARYRLGVVLMRQGELTQAAASVEEAVRLDGAQAAYQLALGEIALRVPDPVRAMAAAGRAASLAGNNPSLWRAIASLHRRAGDGIGEARSLEALLRLTPEDRMPYTRLATLLLEHRTADGALAVAAAGTQRFAQDAELWRLHGLAEYAIGRKEDALRSFLRAIDAAPGDPAGYASLETLLPEAGRLAPEIEKRLVPFAGRDPIGHFLLALLLPEQRERHLREVMARAPEFWPARYETGRLLQERGLRAEAAAEFEAVLRLNPEHAESHYALSQLVPDRGQALVHRREHHRLKQAAAERARAAAKPRINVSVQ